MHRAYSRSIGLFLLRVLFGGFSPLRPFARKFANSQHPVFLGNMKKQVREPLPRHVGRPTVRTGSRDSVTARLRSTTMSRSGQEQRNGRLNTLPPRCWGQILSGRACPTPVYCFEMYTVSWARPLTEFVRQSELEQKGPTRLRSCRKGVKHQVVLMQQ